MGLPPKHQLKYRQLGLSNCLDNKVECSIDRLGKGTSQNESP